MAGKYSRSADFIKEVVANSSLEEVAQRLEPPDLPPPNCLPCSSKATANRAAKFWEALDAPPALRDTLLPSGGLEAYQGNIENCIGVAKMPLGLAGPLRVNGLFAKGDYPIPLATTEAALVASYHRGCRLLNEVGGCRAMVVFDVLHRAPAFAFRTLSGAGQFVVWAIEHMERFKEIVAGTTSHGVLVDCATLIEGNHVYLNFEFTTGDAAGQNMVTIATQAICDFIVANSPIEPERAYVESNLSGDKKASARSFTTVRGKKVTAEAILPAEIVEKRLHTTPKAMCEYWQISAIGGVLSGTIGVQGHFANGLAALFIATGQDAACVAESATGVTRFELTAEGDLYAAVTLPGIVVGTVGGGTSLPTQQACLELMGLAGPGHAKALAEVIAGLLLGGELSIIGALTAGHFTRAHKKLARNHQP